MKKFTYIAAFVIFGFLLQLLLHAAIEIWYLNLLLSDFDRYSFGANWDTLLFVHDVLTILFFMGGIGFGYSQGKFWWYRIYQHAELPTHESQS